MTHSTERAPRARGGERRWPADPAWFADTSRCPACLSPLDGPVCAACGLDLTAPRATDVLASGQRIVAEEHRRQALIDEMFAAQRARETVVTAPRPLAAPGVPATVASAAQVAAQVAARPATAVAPPLPTAPPAGPPVSTGMPVGPPVGLPVAPPAGMPAGPPVGPPVGPPMVPASGPLPPASTAPRRSGMQVFLLTLGVVLISVTAIVFLFVAYLIASLEVRSVIIAIASVLVLVVAALLRRRRLPGTAEGVAVVAVVLLLLDVWIVRANDLFGTGAAEPASYAGIALLVLTGLLTAAAALTRVRALGVSAAALAPTAMFLLGLGAAPNDEPGTALWLGGLVAVVPAIAAALVRLPLVERIVVVSLGAFGGCIAWATAAFALPGVEWHPLATFALVALAWAALLASLAARGRDLGGAWQWVAAVAAGSALAAAPAVAMAVELDLGVAAWSAPAVAIAIATALSASLRLAASPARRAGLGLFAGAAGTALFAAVPAGFAGAAQVGTTLVAAADVWSASATEANELTPSAVVVPFVLAAASTVVALMARRLRLLAAIPLAFAGAGLIVIGASAGSTGSSVAILLGTAAGALALATAPRALPARGVRPTLAVVGPLAAALAWAVGFGAAGVWAFSSAGALALTLGGWALARRLAPHHAAVIAAVHALLAALQVVVVAVALAPWLLELGTSLTRDWHAPTVWVALITATLFGVTRAVRLPLAPRLAFAVPLLVAATLAVAAMLLFGGTTLRWVCALVLALAAIAWVSRGRLVGLTPAAAGVAPIMLAFAAAWVTGDVFGLPGQADASAAAALLVGAALAHVLFRAGGDETAPAARLVWVSAVGAVTLVVAGLAVGNGDWLPLAILTPVPLVLATLWGEPLASSAPTRHLAWGSPALAVTAWWMWLTDVDAPHVELFTLPVAALCVTLGALIAVRRPLAPAVPGRVTLIAAGLALAIVPSVATAGDSAVRALVLLAAGAVVLLATAFAPTSVRGVPIGVLGLSAGAAAAIGGGFAQAMTIAAGSGAPRLEWWSLAVLAVGAGAAVWWARAGRAPRPLAEWLLVVAVVAAVAPTIVAIVGGHHAEVRAFVLLPLLAALHVVTASGAPRPLAGPVPRWSSLALLVVAAVVTLATGLDPADVATAAVGVALIGAGVFDLRRRPALGSWPALGIGLAVLLLPPLVADFVDAELWRIVTLGVVALATLLAGIRWRLQAPFVMGGAVLLVHAVAQLWPWITALYEAVWWWLWLGIAGVLLVVIAATYERQLRTARAAFSRLAALR